MSSEGGELSQGSSERPRVRVVLKFGGSSLADPGRIREVAAKVVQRACDHQVVVVVSAMGKSTNELLALAHTVSEAPSVRELDMLMSTGERTTAALMAMAIEGLGVPAISLTGSQSGIVTTHQHGRARVIEVRPFRIEDELEAGRVVVVGGFQGVSYRRDVTTLGRGGSDTSAVALAAALGADCEIYSDVDGVYTADPRLVPEAERLASLSHPEMAALSRAGAKVLHGQAVALAARHGIAVYARATSEGRGETVIRGNPPEDCAVRAVAGLREVTAVELELGLEAAKRVELFERLSSLGLRHLVVALSARGTLIRGYVARAERTDEASWLDPLAELLASGGCEVRNVILDESVALVSCVGTLLEDHGELIGIVAQALEGAGIGLQAVHAESHALTFAISRADHDRAVQVLHDRLVRS